MGRDKDAIDDLAWLVSERATDDDLIQLAQARIAVGEFIEARMALAQVSYDALDSGGQYDHTYAMFGLLYSCNDPDLRARVTSQLEALDPQYPAWREVRSKFLLALRTVDVDAEPDNKTWWKTIRESLILQPNFFGIGINIGTIIERAIRSRKSATSDTASRGPAQLAQESASVPAEDDDAPPSNAPGL